jgi:SAM-dependent methyltransferase
MTGGEQARGRLGTLLARPWIYDALQSLMRGSPARAEYVRDFIRATERARVLDLGCGTAQVLGFLPDGVDYWGYDVSAEYIDQARTRFGVRGHFACGMPDEETIAGQAPFDVALAIGVLHHLDDHDARCLLRTARRAVRQDGRFVSIDPVSAAGQHPIARLLIANDRGRHVRDAEGYLALARAEFGAVEGTIRHRAWIPYTHWIMECAAAPRDDRGSTGDTVGPR